MRTAATNSVDHIFRALADPTRLRILNLLLPGELCVCDIVTTLRLPQPAVSRHLAYLKDSGLVEARREGLWMYYRLTPPETTFETRLVECLACCVEELPQLAKDSKQLRRSRCC
jgi:ArsR family transcriptional regulator, arsenate/arsenite/antimonite-responsive transcriptional repressor